MTQPNARPSQPSEMDLIGSQAKELASLRAALRGALAVQENYADGWHTEMLARKKLEAENDRLRARLESEGIRDSDI